MIKPFITALFGAALATPALAQPAAIASAAALSLPGWPAALQVCMQWR